MIHGPNVPGSYAILLFTALDFTFSTRPIPILALFPLWPSPFILYRAVPLFFPSSTLDIYQPGEFLFWYPIILPFHAVHGVFNKGVRNAVLGCNLKKDRMISVRFQGKPFNITVIQAYAPTSNTEEAEVERFYEDPTRSFRTNTQKRCPFHYRGLECKSRKSRNTWSNRQIWPWSMDWSRAKANRVLPRKCTGHSKHPLPTTQEKTLHMDITWWSTPKLDWLYSLQPKMEKL